MRPQFHAFERFLVSQAKTFVPEIREAARSVITPKGKYIRPALVFSASVDCANELDLVRRAALVELTHISTLVHDDVIDEALVRRNHETANSKYGQRTAILLGDVIFSHMMMMAFDDADKRVVEHTARCVRTICEGEIRQTLSDKREIVSRKRYYEIVYGKTAALFELSCRLGAMWEGSPSDWAETAAFVGKQLGIAYQIYDDICDWFMSEADAGKTLGTDLISGKQTFPLILLIEKLSFTRAKRFIKDLPSLDFNQVRDMMLEHSVLDDCAKEFLRRVSMAEKALSAYPAVNAKLLRCCAAVRELKF